MSSHPINLLVRFCLELCALAALADWGWQQTGSPFRVAITLGVPFAVAVLWATFAVPGDASRSGATIVPVSGVIRLILEIAIFGAAAWALLEVGHSRLSAGLCAAVVAHYIVSHERISWLLNATSEK